MSVTPTEIARPDEGRSHGADGAWPGEAAGASLDKVRDILFGSQLREMDRRVQRLEERVLKELHELREDGRRRHEALDSHVRRELEALGQGLTSERAARDETEAGLRRELVDAAAQQQRRLGQVEAETGKGLRELRQQLTEQGARLQDELQGRHAEVCRMLERHIGELRGDKADRSTLASLLTEMALRLSGDSPVEVALGGAGLRNGHGAGHHHGEPNGAPPGDGA